MTGILDEKIVKSGRPHDRDAGTNVVAQREKIDHLTKRDQYGLDLENGSFRGGGDCVPQQEGVPQRPSQLQAQPCLLRCTWGGTNNHQFHYKLGEILPLLVSHCWMSSIMVLRNMIQQHIQSVLFNQSSLDFCCLFHEDFLELPGTDVYLLHLGAPVKLSNCLNRKCSFFLLRILLMSHNYIVS